MTISSLLQSSAHAGQIQSRVVLTIGQDQGRARFGDFYQPQGKVIFSKASVCLSTGGPPGGSATTPRTDI